MWNKPNNKHTLTSDEIKILREATAWAVLYWFDSTEKHEMGVSLFDRLHRHEQILAVAHVLAKATNPRIKVTRTEAAWEEATMATLLIGYVEQISANINEEEPPEEHTLEGIRLLNQIGIEVTVEEFKEHIEETESETREQLLDHFLHDRDYEMEEIHNEAKAPGQYQDTLKKMGIHPDYYINVGPDGNKKDGETALQWMMLTWTNCAQSNEAKQLIQQLGEETFKAQLLKSYHRELRQLRKGELVWLTAYEIELLERFKLVDSCYPTTCKPNGLKLLWGETPSTLPVPNPDPKAETLELRQTVKWVEIVLKTESTFLVPEGTTISEEGKNYLGNGLVIDGKEYSHDIIWNKTEKKDGIFEITEETNENIEMESSQNTLEFKKRKP